MMTVMVQMCMALGGRAAETVMFGSLSTGAADDLQKVTKMAYGLSIHYGMISSVGPLAFRRSKDEVQSAVHTHICIHYIHIHLLIHLPCAFTPTHILYIYIYIFIYPYQHAYARIH